MTEFQARPTVYKGIKMRSRLEAGFAAWLDGVGFTWDYEPCAYATEAGQYLPDFRIHDLRVSWKALPIKAYIEVKPPSFDDLELLVLQMEVIQASEPEAVCLLQKAPPHESIQPGRVGLGVLWQRGNSGPLRTDLPFTAFRRALWALTETTPMVVLPLRAETGPWPDNYWQVGG